MLDPADPDPPVRKGPPPLVIGLGNEHRGDDACGLLVARLLRPRLASVGPVVELDAEGTELLDLWDGRDLVVVVDAVRTGARPGTVRRIEVGSEPLTDPVSLTSSHGISLGQAIGFAQALHRLPRRLLVYGIEAEEFTPGAEVSEPVREAIEPTAQRIEEEVRGGAPRRLPAPGRAASHA